MFLPTGPNISLDTNGTASGSISFSGIDRNNPVLRTDADANAHLTLTFSSGEVLDVFGGEKFFRIPEAASSASVSLASVNTTARSLCGVAVGENV